MDKGLVEMFELLSECPAEIQEDGCDRELAYAIYSKLWWVLASRVNKSIPSCPYIMKEDGRVYDDESSTRDISLSGDIMLEEMFVNAQLEEYVSEYYLTSGYWIYDCRETVLYDDLDELTEGQREDYAYLTDREYPDFFEDKAFDMFASGAVSSPLEYFTLFSDEYGQSCIVLKSILLPYFLRLDEELLRKEHDDLRQLVEKAIHEITTALEGGCQSILEKDMEASYFILFDGYDACYGVGMNGSRYVKKSFLLAGRIIDEAILELDTYYHFLPQNLRKEK